MYKTRPRDTCIQEILVASLGKGKAMIYEEFEKLAAKHYNGEDHGMCTHDYEDCTVPLRIAYERFYKKMLLGNWVICKECGCVRVVSAFLDVRPLIGVPIFNKVQAEKRGICSSCTRSECKHRIEKDGEQHHYNEVQTRMVHEYICWDFTQEGSVCSELIL